MTFVKSLPKPGSPLRSRPILVCNVMSGLGNQLFQYAFARWMAEKSNADLCLNTSWYDSFQTHRPKRHERLHRLGLYGCTEFTDGFPRWLLGLSGVGSVALRQKVQRITSPLLGVDYFNESLRYRFPLEDLPMPTACRPLVLSGYWQFSQAARVLGRVMGDEINRSWPWSPGASAISEAIRSAPNAAFLHVRRGDYLKFGMHTLGIDYYKKAALLIESRMGISPRWFVFSEDKSWCRNHLGFLAKSTLVDYTSDDSDIEDILLMTQCRGGVIANSSFSWWGAALANQQGRPIVSPRQWNGTLESDAWEMAFPEWMSL